MEGQKCLSDMTPEAFRLLASGLTSLNDPKRTSTDEEFLDHLPLEEGDEW